MRLKNSLSFRFMASVAAIIAGMMVINLIWIISQQKNQAEAQMREKAAVIAEQLIATRAFIADAQDTINYDSGGNFEFKHLNPAAVGKKIGYIFNQSSGYRFKQTRFDFREPENAPDNFEQQMMKKLATDNHLTEIYGYDIIEGTKVFRYLVPLYYDDSCLPCHGKPQGEIDISNYLKEGHETGEFAGAISIVFPMALFEENIKTNIITQIVFFIFIAGLIISAIYFLMEHIVIKPIGNLTDKAIKVGQGQLTMRVDDIHTYDEMRSLAAEFNDMARKLQQIYSELEDKVAERTRMLVEANSQLVKQGEELMIMNSKLSEADRLKSEFLAVMSHELRTPLTAIIAFSETLLEEAQSLSELHREFINDILDSAYQLLNEINNILDMSKIEAGLIRLNLLETDFAHIIAGISRILTPLIARKNLTYTTNIAADLPLILADREKVAHILRNLIGNAVKFTPEGRSVMVTVESAEEPGYSVKVSIADTGIGISAEGQKNIFDKFYQMENTQETIKGSGLGLSLAKNLVELHGGKIWLESVQGQGSTFTFILP